MYDPLGNLNFATTTRKILKVTGRRGAEAMPMGPNSEVLLLDETAPIVWLKTTDAAGYPTLTAYDIKLHEEEKPVDYSELDARLKKLEELLNAKSDAPAVAE